MTDFQLLTGVFTKLGVDYRALPAPDADEVEECQELRDSRVQVTPSYSDTYLHFNDEGRYLGHTDEDAYFGISWYDRAS